MHIQRAALLLSGPDITWNPKVDDDNPPRWYEPLPSGPYKGQTTDKADFLENKQRYFRKIGSTNRGIPKSSELQKLGVEDVDNALKRLS
jgi:aldehyde:ferredoxin oxidoreductase